MADKRLFRFGVFEIDAASGELRKAGMRVRLQEQPSRVLLMLVERPGEVIARDELRQKLWPADTFVDFDHSLNTIINKLREVLGDSASSPRFIETLAKRGYRFLPSVETIGNGREEQAASEAGSPSSHASSSFSVLTQPEDLPPVPHGYVRVLFLLIQVMYLSFYVAALARLSAVQDLLARVMSFPDVATILVLVTAAIGIPLRLYLLSSVSFNVKGLTHKFLKLFPAAFVLDELWALSPFLLTPQIGIGLALAATAALIYVPFAQRTLVLMRNH